MSLDLSSLFPDLEALTPDGRWQMLQDWLAKNPEYGERVDEWVKQPPAQVFTEIRAMAIDKYGPLASIALNAQPIREKLLNTIEILQICYRERAGIKQSRGEIDGYVAINDPRPSGHKSIGDYQSQLKAKKKRRKR